MSSETFGTECFLKSSKNGGSKEFDTSTSYAIDNDELDIAEVPEVPEGVILPEE